MARPKPSSHRITALAVGGVVAVLIAGGLVVVASSQEAAAEVKGSACSFKVNIGLFGGPLKQRGCGAEGAAFVELPPGGSDEPLTAEAPGGKAVYGPATVHGGRWPCAEGGDRNCPDVAPPSGPQAASTSSRGGT